MTDTPNKKIALDYLAALYDGDIARAVSFLDDNIDFLVNAPIEILPHLGHRQGKASVREMLDTIRDRYPEMRHEILSVIADGDNVATHIRVFFRKRQNNRIVQIDLADFFSFRDGRIVRIRHFMDSFDLVQQALEVDITDILEKNPRP